jgi:DeoR/GlpR family transcriptional regulator of sugar metabolism
MEKEKRLYYIREVLAKKGEITVDEIARVFNVSKMTARRDLQALMEQGIIERTYGGAILSPKTSLTRSPLLLRVNDQREEKEAIGLAVAKMMVPGETIYLAAGTTTYWVAKALVEKRMALTVVTNSLPVADLLIPHEDIEVIVTGGFLNRNERSLVGHFAERMIRDLRMDKVVVGCSGIHPEYGLTNENPQEMMMDRAYIQASDNVIVVADHTKFGQVRTSRIAPITAIRTIVTTRLAPMDMVERIRQQGVEVIQV